MSSAPETRASLLLRLSQADEAAWREFVELYEPLILGFARQRGLQEADARDLCQEVLRALPGAIARFDPQRTDGTFRGWLARIARNMIINQLQARQRHVAGTGDTALHQRLAEQPAPEGEESALFDLELQRRTFRWAAERVRASCAENTWLAFWRTAVEGQPAAAVASELSMSVGAVYIARSRVIARLREQVEQVSGRLDAKE